MTALHDAVLALHRAHLSDEQQWCELMTALALAGAVPEGQGRTDLLAHAADLAWQLTGTADHLDGLLPEDREQQIASAARGRESLRLVVDALEDADDD